MKVLVDSCVWSLSLRRKLQTRLSNDEQRMVALLSDAIQDGRVAIVGPIRQEWSAGRSIFCSAPSHAESGGAY